MAKVVPPAPRACVSEDWEGLRIVVPSRRDWFALIFLPFWLTGWAFGEVMVLGSLLTGNVHGPVALFVIAWLAIWTCGGAWAIFNWCWNAAGREVVTVQSDAFSVRYEAFGVGKTWEFEPSLVENLRLIEGGAMPSPWSVWSLWSQRKRRDSSWNQTDIWNGPLSFDYGAETFRFGAGLGEAEARQLLPALLRRLSPNDDPPAAQKRGYGS